MRKFLVDFDLITGAAGKKPARRGGFEVEIEFGLLAVRFTVNRYAQLVKPHTAIAGVERAEVDVCRIHGNLKIDLVALPVLRSGRATIVHVVEFEHARFAVDTPPES